MGKSKEPIIINNENELKDYLIRKGENHNYYHHFTTSKTLNSIIHNNSIRLTLGNSEELNDHHEFSVEGTTKVWERTYLFCFSYGISENMAMWGVYGLPSKEAVRLSIARECIKTIKDKDKIKIFSDSKMTFELNKNAIENIFLTDIFYVKDKKGNMDKQRHRDYDLVFPNNNIHSILTSEQATGVVKNDVWNYENEVRLIIRFKKAQKNENNKLLEYIYLKFPEEVLGKIGIMKGPAFEERYVNKKIDLSNMGENKIIEENNNEELMRNIASINEKINKKNEENKKEKKNKKIILVEPTESRFKGLIHFKSDDFIQVIKNDKRENR